MRIALVNPAWRFDGSIYFGCREPHLPLEFGYARALLEAAAGNAVLLVDAQIEGLSDDALFTRVAEFAPDMTVIPTAPTYLFWRCPPPELRVPQETAALLRAVGGRRVLVGPHASTTPAALLAKVDADAAVLGECEEVLVELTQRPWASVAGVALRDGTGVTVNGGPRAADMRALPALRWPRELLHAHHHHRFDGGGHGLGAEMEVSRGCPYHCSFCAKDNFRDKYRRRPLATVLEELDGLIDQGVGYVYFIDEILLPDEALLDALAERPVEFGIQTRIDLWKPAQLDLLGEAGCVSIEAGVESISEAGQRLVNKQCRLSSAELRARLVRARRTVPFVQASLIDAGADDADEVAAWRESLIGEGVWVNKPVPMFLYPGSPGYVQQFGLPDAHAWERAVDHYLATHHEYSDIQEAQPLPLDALELPARA